VPDKPGEAGMTDLRYDSRAHPSGAQHADRTPPLSRVPHRRAAPPEAPAAHFPGQAPEPARPSTLARQAQTLLNWTGAALSIALIIGVSVWGYRLTVRDVSGVPVVRALEGPMRIAPAEPGGSQAAYRGLSVNSVAAGTGARPPAEEIVLAPPPVSLDTPLPNPRNVQPTMAGLAAEAPAEVTQASARIAAGPGLARSPIPPARPGGDLVAEAAAQAVVAAITGGTARNIDVSPDSLHTGTRLVQLGAFDSPEDARAEWDRLARRFAPLMEGRGRVVQQAESGGRSFYRLRAHGFAEEAEARQFCAALVAENATCIPVLLR